MVTQFNRPWRNGSVFLATSVLLTGLFVIMNYQRGAAQAQRGKSGAAKGSALV